MSEISDQITFQVQQRNLRTGEWRTAEYAKRGDVCRKLIANSVEEARKLRRPLERYVAKENLRIVRIVSTMEVVG
jgi:hypothetical protein